MTANSFNASRGFTLIEIIIALSIVSIAILALSKSIFESVKISNVQQQKLITSWVASNELASVRLQLIANASSSLNTTGTAKMAGKDWDYQVKSIEHPKLSDVRILSVEVLNDEQKVVASQETYVVKK